MSTEEDEDVLAERYKALSGISDKVLTLHLILALIIEVLVIGFLGSTLESITPVPRWIWTISMWCGYYFTFRKWPHFKYRFVNTICYPVYWLKTRPQRKAVKKSAEVLRKYYE